MEILFVVWVRVGKGFEFVGRLGGSRLIYV